MTHFIVEPEVAGGLGENTVLAQGRHPPIVERLHYAFDGWLGDVLLETYPAFIVTEEARRALVQGGVSGARFEAVEVSLSDRFLESNPGVTLPPFVRLCPEGVGGRDDVATDAGGRLILSRRALDILEPLGLSQALVGPFTG